MAETKYLNTRIQLKYDSYNNWTTKNPTLLEGELAIAYLGQSHTSLESGAKNHPVLFKVGAYKLDASGNKTSELAKFNDLPWASALAADVYDWAKKENLAFADLPTIPVVDTENGKFVIDVEYTANGIVIHRANVVAADIADAPWLTSESKDYGKVTADAGELEADEIHDTFAIKGNEKAIATKAENNAVVVDLKLDHSGNVALSQSAEGLKAEVDLSEYAKTEDLVDNDTVTVVEEGTGIKVEKAVEGSVHTYTVSHQEKPTEGTAEAATAGSGRTYVTEVLVDELGHIAGVKTATETVVDTDTNTITTVSGDGKYIKVERTDGENDTRDYKVSAIEDELKNLIGTVTTAAMDFKGVTASLPAEGIKGDMYKVTDTFIVDADNDAQGAGFTAKSGDSIVCDGDNKWYLIPSGDDVEDTWRHVKVNDEQVLGNGVDANKPLEIKNGTNSTDKYASFEVNGKVVKAEVVGYQPAGNYKTIQDPVEDPTANGTTLEFISNITQNKNGEITPLKKTVDLSEYAKTADLPTNHKIIQTPVDNKITNKAHVLTSLTQDANGEIAYDVKVLTLGDITDKDFKEKQTAVTVGPEDHKWVNSISQDENGVISASLKRPSGYDLEEVSTAKNKDDAGVETEVPCLIFYCGDASTLI